MQSPEPGPTNPIDLVPVPDGWEPSEADQLAAIFVDRLWHYPALLDAATQELELYPLYKWEWEWFMKVRRRGEIEAALLLGKVADLMRNVPHREERMSDESAEDLATIADWSEGYGRGIEVMPEDDYASTYGLDTETY